MKIVVNRPANIMHDRPKAKQAAIVAVQAV